MRVESRISATIQLCFNRRFIYFVNYCRCSIFVLIMNKPKRKVHLPVKQVNGLFYAVIVISTKNETNNIVTKTFMVLKIFVCFSSGISLCIHNAYVIRLIWNKYTIENRTTIAMITSIPPLRQSS